MKANELRIGDWVMIYGSQQKIHSIDENSVNGDFYGDGAANYLDGCSPIPLTPEILEKVGFEKRIDTGNEFYTHGSFALYKTDGGFLHNACDVSIDSLHQLQNLVYILTGTELEINLT